MKKKFNLLFCLIVMSVFIGFQSCDSDNDYSGREQALKNEQKNVEELRALYGEIQVGETKIMNDILIKISNPDYVSTIQMRNAQSETGSSKFEKYYNKYFGKANGEVYLKAEKVDYNEIIMDAELTLEERQFAIISLSALEFINEDAENTTSLFKSGASDCLSAYRAELNRITLKYTYIVAQSWIGVITGGALPNLISSISLMSDALSGEHIKEIKAAEARYDECLKKVSTTLTNQVWM